MGKHLRTTTKTPWAVICREHGQQFLTREGYRHQMDRPDSLWACPICGEESRWDDDNYESEEFDGEEVQDESPICPECSHQHYGSGDGVCPKCKACLYANSSQKDEHGEWLDPEHEYPIVRCTKCNQRVFWD